jgi:RNA polymerase sigma-54 factor
MKKALWFLRSLDQRNQTIYKVARAVAERQREFLEKGMEFLRPLTLMEIAQEVGVHESTVGRVVANKHILTPRGTFSLKYFFHKSLAGGTGERSPRSGSSASGASSARRTI